MTDDLIKELRSYPAHYVAAHRAADALEKREYYNCRLEDDLVAADLETESLRKHIAEQQLDIITLGQEVGRMREALEKIIHEDLWTTKHPDGVTQRGESVFDGYFVGIARAALGEEKK